MLPPAATLQYEPLHQQYLLFCMCETPYFTHATNKIAGRMIPILVLGFWDENTVMCAGAMPYQRDFPAAPKIF